MNLPLCGDVRGRHCADGRRRNSLVPVELPLWRTLVWPGALLWGLVVGPKLLFSYRVTSPALEMILQKSPVAAGEFFAAVLLGLQSSLFQIGLVFAAGLIWRELGNPPRKVIRIGLGAGAFEALLLGLSRDVRHVGGYRRSRAQRRDDQRFEAVLRHYASFLAGRSGEAGDDDPYPPRVPRTGFYRHLSAQGGEAAGWIPAVGAAGLYRRLAPCDPRTAAAIAAVDPTCSLEKSVQTRKDSPKAAVRIHKRLMHQLCFVSRAAIPSCAGSPIPED